MKIARFTLSSLVAIAICAQGTSALANTKIADVMGLVSDQLVALTEVQKGSPQTVTPKAFRKAQSRCRATQLLFGLLNDKKGSFDTGKLVVGDMTPDKLTTLSGQDQEDLFKKYGAALVEISSGFGDVETELAAQAGNAAETRDFTTLESKLTAVAEIMKKSHKLFR